MRYLDSEVREERIEYFKKHADSRTAKLRKIFHETANHKHSTRTAIKRWLKLIRELEGEEGEQRARTVLEASGFNIGSD